jgi:hypothetical protein
MLVQLAMLALTILWLPRAGTASDRPAAATIGATWAQACANGTGGHYDTT